MSAVAPDQGIINKVQELLLGIADSVELVQQGVFTVRHGSAGGEW